jgi:putative GTP pyrophosphokinase
MSTGLSRVTENQPKFDRGDDRHKEFFRLGSEIIARTVEDRFSCRADLSDEELCRQFRELDGQINVLRFLYNLPVIEQESRVKNNVILHAKQDGELTVHKYPDLKSATDGYFALEKANPGDDIVFVRAKTFDAIRSAYRNYFQNTADFLNYIETGLEYLEQTNSDGEILEMT